jgi:hypothetical protein
MKRAIYFLLALLIPVLALAQGQEAQLTATVDRSRLAVGERMTLTIKLEGDNVENNGPFPAPDLMPYLWQVDKQGPFSQQNVQMINGVFTRSGSLRMDYIYEAKQAGTVTIAPIRYRVNGILVQSDPIKVEVSEPSAPETQAVDTSWQPPSDPYLEIRLDKSQAYVGEQIVASWYIYFRRPFFQASLSQQPTAGDFVSADLGQVSQLNPMTKSFGGTTWQLAFLKATAFFPIKAGDDVIEPLAITFGYDRGQGGFFGVMPEQHTASSKSVTVKVLPLPGEGKPGDFSGAVGDFKITFDRDSGSVKVNEQFKFIMTVEGTAHPDYMPKPEAALGSEFDLYTEAADKRISQDKGQARSQRTFNMILVPHQPGTFTLPPFTFSYFDPADKTYKVARSQQIKLVVTGTAQSASSAGSGEEPGVIKTVGQDLRYIKPDRPDLKEQRLWIISSPLLLAAQLAPLLAVALAWGLRRRSDRFHHDVAYARKSRAVKRSRKILKEASAAVRAEEAAQAFALVHRAVAGYVADRLNLPDLGMTTADAAASLRQFGISEEKAQEVEAVLSECDRARFMPGALSASSAAKLLERAEALLKRMEKENGK